MAKKHSEKPAGDRYQNSTGVYTLVDGVLIDENGQRVHASKVSSKHDPLKRIED